MTSDTTALSYWLNWRFLLCAIWVIVAIVCSAFIIWRHEGHRKSGNRMDENQQGAGCLYKGEAWGTCSKSIHPIWLLAFRIVAFGALLALLLADTIKQGVGMFYFYTIWTLTLVTIYFGLASSLSVYGCLQNRRKVGSKRDHCVGEDAEQGSYMVTALGEETDKHTSNKSPNQLDDPNCRTASVWEYALQIIFQVSAGAVVLADSFYWLVIYAFLVDKDYRLTFLSVCVHSVNAVFLLVDVTLNSLHFPFFRIAYFVLWACVYFIFQWILHACVSMSWPYPFLDLSSQHAPIWYLAVGLLQLPCFGIFILIFKIKQYCFSR